MTEDKLTILNSIKDLLEDHPERREMLTVLEEIVAENKYRGEFAIKAADAVKKSHKIIADVKKDMIELKGRNDTLYKKNKDLLESLEAARHVGR